MGIWSVNSVSDESKTVVSSWKVFEVPEEMGLPPTRHIVGYVDRLREGRVSSPIVEFDKSEMCGISRSGRKYYLSGPSGVDSDALYVWNVWCNRNNVTAPIDVSSEY